MSWAADSQLLRDDVDGYNLSLGEPYFLYDEMIKAGIYPTNDLGHQQYPKTTPEPELLEQLRVKHPTGHIIVANGAKQAISAAMYYYGKILKQEAVYHSAPYWPAYPTLSGVADLNLYTTITDTHTVTINTYPNNPDGRTSRVACDLWDAAYYHPVYMPSSVFPYPPMHDVSVWSAAKLFGCSGVRVGWLHTENEELAKHAKRYVEQTTSGVCVGAQRFIGRTMKRIAKGYGKEPYAVAKYSLAQNRKIFEKISEYVQSSRYNAGMFAWFEPKDYAKFSKSLELSGVKMVTGDACGGPKTFYRMSLGHRVSYTQEAIDALLRELEK